MATQTTENFGKFDSTWIMTTGRRWEKDGRIRYYFNSILPVFDLLGIGYKLYKSGSFANVEGYSNNNAFRLSLAFKGTYFDAVEGRFVGSCSLQADLEKALIV